MLRASEGFDPALEREMVWTREEKGLATYCYNCVDGRFKCRGVRGRLRLSWIYSVKVASGSTGMKVELREK